MDEPVGEPAASESNPTAEHSNQEAISTQSSAILPDPTKKGKTPGNAAEEDHEKGKRP